MNDTLFLFLSLSVSGSLLALIMFLLRPVIKTKLSQTWQYYIWLIVILRFLLPLTPQISIVGELSRRVQDLIVPPAITEVNPNADVNEENIILQTPNTQPPSSAPSAVLHDAEADTPARPNYWREIQNNVWLLWFAVALVLFVHKVASYRSFVRFIRVGIEEITDEHMLTLYQDEVAQANIKRRLSLYRNNQVVSPMLVGIIRPALVIPKLDASDGELRNILRHELTHYKRLDYIYKWLVQIMLCLHWFNPLVYLIVKRINKSCELSCDETVIRRLDENGRMIYGDALIASLTAQGNYSNFVVSMTMSENGNIVKERLDMIVNYKKKTILASCVALILTVLLLCGFTFAGAYKEINNEHIVIVLNNNTNEVNNQSLEKPNHAIEISVDRISAGQVVCVGEITVDGSLPLTYDVMAASGQEFFVALGKTDSITSVKADQWWNAMTNKSNVMSIQENFHNSLVHGTFYVYVGNDGSVPLTNVSGSVYQGDGGATKDIFLFGIPYSYTFDATAKLKLDMYEVTASDKNLNKSNVEKEIQQWISDCDQATGAYLYQQITDAGYTYFLYYNGGGRYPWGIGEDGDSLYINLINPAITSDGYNLIKIEAPIKQTILLMRDGAELPITTNEKPKAP
jgi:beta-lactamase regulating signal transducer with metallopeptidase domain